MNKLYEEYKEQLDELWSEAMREHSYHNGYRHALQFPIYLLFDKVEDKDELIDRLLEEQHDWEAEAESSITTEDAKFDEGAAQACKDTIEMLKTTK